jgi:ankyrin repeat protein
VVSAQQHPGNPPRGGSELWNAAFNGNLATVESCVARGESVNATGPGGFSALVAASRNGHFEVVKYLVEHGANIEQASNNRDKTALLAAAFKGHLDIVGYLIEKGANVNAQSINGFTPLTDAAINGDIRVVTFLVEHGADVRIKDVQGLTPRGVAEKALLHYDRKQQRAREMDNVQSSRADFERTIEFLKQHGG